MVKVNINWLGGKLGASLYQGMPLLISVKNSVFITAVVFDDITGNAIMIGQVNGKDKLKLKLKRRRLGIPRNLPKGSYRIIVGYYVNNSSGRISTSFSII